MVKQLKHMDKTKNNNELHSRILLQIHYQMEENLIIYVDGLLALHAAQQSSAKKSHERKMSQK